MSDRIDTKKERLCSYLLPDPGGEVVRRLVHVVDRLQAERDALRRANESLLEIAAVTIDTMKALDRADDATGFLGTIGDDACEAIAKLGKMLTERLKPADNARDILASKEQDNG